MELNKINESHFAPLNKKRWEKLHKEAVEKAQRSAKGSGVVSGDARVINGFAAHYLTDAFAAGHMIDKKAVKAAAEASLGTGTNRVNLAFQVAAGLRADKKVAAELATREIRDSAVVRVGWYPADNQARLTSLLESVMRWNEDAFLSVFVRIAHDDLNTAISSGHGAWVSNAVGDRWQLSGDTTLAESDKTREIARKAVKASEDNLVVAASTKDPPWWQPFTDALDDATIKAMFQNVWQYVPTPTTSTLAGEGTVTGEAQVAAAVAKYTNAAHPDTVKAIVELSIKEFPTALAELGKEGLIRPRAGVPPVPPVPPAPVPPAPIPPPQPPAPDPHAFPRSGTAKTTGTLLRIRTGPGLKFPALRVIENRGTPLVVETQQHGESVAGNDVWDLVEGGWVSDYFVAFD